MPLKRLSVNPKSSAVCILSTPLALFKSPSRSTLWSTQRGAGGRGWTVWFTLGGHGGYLGRLDQGRKPKFSSGASVGQGSGVEEASPPSYSRVS